MNDGLPDQSRLNRWERASLLTLTVLIVGFGVVTEIRSAFQNDRKTDLTVYARAGWAVRAGEDLYSVADEHGWHYCYPSAFAVAMVPFADPPFNGSSAVTMPFALSVAIWYCLSVIAVCYAVHVMASAILPNISVGSRIWWMARMGPFWIVVGGIGMTLGRGQVNLFVLALWAAAIAASIRGQSLKSGFWLGVATCIKVIPGLLFIVPLLRRDWRSLAGGIIAAIVFFGIVPTAVWGPQKAFEYNREMLEQIVGPGVFGGTREVRAEELTNATATDNQSFQYVIHNWRHPNEATRPASYESISKVAHLAISFVMLVVSAWGIIRANRNDASLTLIGYGTLALVMTLASPVSHMHYYAFALPLVAGLWLRSLIQHPGEAWPDRKTLICLSIWGIVIFSSFIPIPYWKALRPYGTCTLATFLLWAYGVSVLFCVSRIKTKNAERLSAFAPFVRQ